MQQNNTDIINIAQMCRKIGKGRTTLFCWVRDGKFPKPLMIGSRTLGWTTAQYDQWLNELEATNHE